MRALALVVLLVAMPAWGAATTPSPAPTPSPNVPQRIEMLQQERAKLVEQCQRLIAQHDGAINALQDLLPEATPK